MKEIENRVGRFENGCLRKILKIMWYDHVSEIELRKRKGQQLVVEVVKNAPVEMVRAFVVQAR